MYSKNVRSEKSQQEKSSAVEGIKKLLNNFRQLPEAEVSNEEKNQLVEIITQLDEIHDLKMKLRNKKPEEIKADTNLTEDNKRFDVDSKKLCDQLKDLLQQARFSKIKINNPSFHNGQMSLADVLYNTSLVLANINPINSDCPITYDKIDPENRVVVSTRFKFDAMGLYGLLKSRPLKSLANPLNREEFSERDKQTILNRVDQWAKKQNPPKKIELFSGNPYPNGDPDHAATLALVQELTQQPQPQGGAQALGFFNQPMPVWERYTNWWELYNSGGEINRYREYRNRHATHIYSMSLSGYQDGTFGINVHPGNNNDIISTENNVRLIQALNNQGINANSAHVVRFPSANNLSNSFLELRGTANEMAAHINQIIATIESVDGAHALDPIRNEITTSLTPFLTLSPNV